MAGCFHTMTHLFECPDPAVAQTVMRNLWCAGGRYPLYPWRNPEHWALRAGMLTPTLVQAESMTIYGTDGGLADYATESTHGVRVVQACVDEEVLRGPTSGPGLMLGFNYVVTYRRHDLPAVAEALGGGRTIVAGALRDLQVLCLPEVAPLRLVRGRLTDAVMVDDGIGRLLYAFATADAAAAGQRSSLLLGLHTPGLGFVHLLTLVLGLEKPRWEHTGTVDVQDGARLNKVSYEFTTGPNGDSSRFSGPLSVTLLPARWPL